MTSATWACCSNIGIVNLVYGYYDATAIDKCHQKQPYYLLFELQSLQPPQPQRHRLLRALSFGPRNTEARLDAPGKSTVADVGNPIDDHRLDPWSLRRRLSVGWDFLLLPS